MNHLKKTNIIKVSPGDKVRLDKIDTGDKGEYKSKEETFERLEVLRERRMKLQERLYAESKRSLLIVLQATDTGGKDGAMDHLLTGLNPAGIRVTSFKAPTALELAHDFLWRIHAAVPTRGTIGLWNRSHYEDVLITRVHGMIDKKTCETRYTDINAFEKLLADNGTVILKFFLHISKKEQKERLQARLADPEKHWKFSPNDLKERTMWDDYQAAYADAISACSTKAAPWYIVPADSKWSRNIALAEVVTAAMEEMDPQFPKVDFNPSEVIID